MTTNTALSKEMNEILSVLKKETEMDSTTLRKLSLKEFSLFSNKMGMIEEIERGVYKDEEIKKMMEIVEAIEKFYADEEIGSDLDVLHSLVVDGGYITIESNYLAGNEIKTTYIGFKNGNFVVNGKEQHEQVTAQILLNNIELELFGVH